MKPKTSGQSNLIGTRTEEVQSYKSIASHYKERDFCFLNYYVAKSMKCNGNAVSGTTKYALVQKARDSSFFCRCH